MALPGISLHSILEYGATQHLVESKRRFSSPPGGHPGDWARKLHRSRWGELSRLHFADKITHTEPPLLCSAIEGRFGQMFAFGTPHAIGILVSMTQILSFFFLCATHWFNI